MDRELGMRVEIIVTSAAQLASVYALLGGAALAAVAAGNITAAPVKQATEPASAGPVTSVSVEPESESDISGPTATSAASPPANDGEVDAGGHPWSADMHAATRGKTKDGYWRMKVGVSRPDPLPGFPLQASGSQSGADGEAPTGTSESGAASEPTASASEPAAPSADEDDEFAAFRAAAAESDAKDEAAKAAVPARKWTDADLGALCNQAAVKMGDPAPIKAIIGEFVPEGEVAHSRNIPEDRREEFARAVEAKAGIEFAG